jgi:hypothetical protein
MRIGVSCLMSVGTSGGALTSAREHIEALERFKAVVGL